MSDPQGRAALAEALRSTAGGNWQTFPEQAAAILGTEYAFVPAAEIARLRAFVEKVAVSENDTPGTRAAARYALTGSLEGAIDEMRRAALEDRP
jgi:hypothetical protein